MYQEASLPPLRPHDCAIDLLPSTSPPCGSLFSLSASERAAMESSEFLSCITIYLVVCQGGQVYIPCPVSLVLEFCHFGGGDSHGPCDGEDRL